MLTVDGVTDGVADDPNTGSEIGVDDIVNGFDDPNPAGGFGGESMPVDNAVDADDTGLCNGKPVSGGVLGVDIDDNMG